MMAEMYPKKCTFESVPVRKMLFCKYLPPSQVSSENKGSKLNWLEATLHYQYVYIHGREDIAIIYL